MQADTSRLYIATALILAITTTGIGVSPWGLWLEENIGLSWLFPARGQRAAPDQILVIAMDKYSANRLALSNTPGTWPRHLHAQMLNHLAEAGVQSITFDILFRNSRDPAEDQALAEAIKKAGNVILFEYLKKDVIDNEAAATWYDALVIEQRIPPVDIFATHAVAVAPFPLPTVPVKVSQYWKYALGAGDAPTMPGVTLQFSLLDVYPQFIQLLDRIDPELSRAFPATKDELIRDHTLIDFMQSIRRLYLENPRLEQQLLQQLAHAASLQEWSDEVTQQLVIFCRLHAGPSSEYLNYYGPPRSIKTLSYYDALKLLENRQYEAFTDKIIFIGSSEAHQWEQTDGFYSVFSQRNGLDISGVEIAATALANQIENLPLHRLSTLSNTMILLAWPWLLLSLGRRLTPLWSIMTTTSLSLAYFLVCLKVFNSSAWWLPIITPLLIQTPLALILDLSSKASGARRQRENLLRAFGYYLPARQINKLVKSSSSLPDDSETVFGICLFTDAEQYTTLAEGLPPAALSRLINDYYACLFKPVEQYGGFVSDIKGDAMLALWTSAQEQTAIKQAACEAAQQIALAIDEFNRQQQYALPTRIGLHCGEIALGHVGAGSHYEYRAVGDIVNTASRIENLNKLLGTRLLVSAEILHGTDIRCHREVGRFRLAGKHQALTIHEILDSENTSQQRHLEQFAQALQAYYQREWQTAAQLFSGLVNAPGLYAAKAIDSVSEYYLRLCQQHIHTPPLPHWTATISLDQK